MGLSVALQALCEDSVTVTAPGGRNDYGELAAGASTVYTVRCVGKPTEVKTAGGDLVISEVQVYFTTMVTIDPESTIQIPVRFTDRTPKILAVAYFPGRAGNDDHTVVYT